MSKEIICGIYKITSPTGRIYIGQSLNIHKYRKAHYARNECKDQPRLCNSINKYGWETHSFEIVEECLFEDLNCRERFWQDYYVATGKNGLNCVLVSCEDIKAITSDETRAKMSASRMGVRRSEETKKKLREAKTGDKNPMYGKFGELNHNFGKPLSEEHKQKLKDRPVLKGEEHPWFGQKHTEETKKLLSELRQGTNKGEENPWFGKVHSDETKEKMSKIKKESLTPDVLNRLKELSIKGTQKKKELWVENPEMKETFKDNCSDANSKYSFIKINVLTNEIIEEFKSMREVYKKHPDASLSSIYAVCSGKNKTSLGFKWKRRLKTTGVIEEPVIKPNKKGNKKEVLNRDSLIVYSSCTEAERVNNFNRGYIANKLLGYSKNNTSYLYLKDFLEENPNFDTSLFTYYLESI